MILDAIEFSQCPRFFPFSRAVANPGRCRARSSGVLGAAWALLVPGRAISARAATMTLGPGRSREDGGTAAQSR